MNNENVNIEFEKEPPLKYRKRVYVYFFLLVALVFSIFTVKTQWQNHLRVKHVIVEGNHILSSDEVVRLMKLPPGVSMFDVDLTILQKNILANSFVKEAVIKRDSPSMLRVILEERKPSAIIVAENLYCIDNDCILLPYLVSSETYDLPVISGIDSFAVLRIGQQVRNHDVREALEILKAAKAINMELFHIISEVRLRKGGDIILYSFEHGTPIIFGKGDVAKKMVKLDAFWQQLLRKNDSDNIQYIDIRFDDQVVVSKKS